MSLMSRLLRFSGMFLLSFALLSLAWPLFAPGYNRLVVGMSNKLLALIEEPLIITLKPQGENVLIYQNDRTGEEPQLVKAYRGYMYFNLILLLALFLATPRLRLLQRLKLTLIALITLLVFHAVDVTTRGVEQYVDQASITVTHSYSVTWRYLFYWFGAVLSVGEKLAPLLIWGILTFKYWLPKPDLRVKVKAKDGIGRNDPCPCGSGKKYKLCCGRKV